MRTFKFRITQIYEVRRSTTIEVEAEDLDEAERTASLQEAPPFEDPNWKDEWLLESEEVEGFDEDEET